MDALMLEMKTHKLKKPSLSFEPAKKTHLMTELQLRFAQMEKENEWWIKFNFNVGIRIAHS